MSDLETVEAAAMPGQDSGNRSATTLRGEESRMGRYLDYSGAALALDALAEVSVPHGLDNRGLRNSGFEKRGVIHSSELRGLGSHSH
jgi:hypothetical protein